MTLQFQKEIQDGLRLENTIAGRVVMNQLYQLQERHERDLEMLCKQLADATTHRVTAAEIQKGYEEKLLTQTEAADQVRMLQEADIETLRKENEELEKEGKGGCVIL